VKIKLLLLCALVALGAATTAFANGSGGVTGPAFYFDGELYRTVNTPTDLTGTGAPEHSFDTIYALAGQLNVTTVAPAGWSTRSPTTRAGRRPSPRTT
jgi:hypothetical protein